MLSFAAAYQRMLGFNGTNWRNIGIDQVTRVLPVISYAHHEIHGGSAYVINDVQNINTTTVYWMITTPNTTVWAHMEFHFECTGEIYVLITEGADRTGTTALTPINRNRNSGNSATIAVHRGYSAGTTNGATTIYNHRAGATGAGVSGGQTGAARGINEYMLKQNTKYIIAVTTYANVYATVVLDWYEHTNQVA